MRQVHLKWNLVELITREDDNHYRCTVCEKKIGHKNDMRKHLETHLTGLSYDCQYCGKSFRLKISLLTHQYRHHQ